MQSASAGRPEASGRRSEARGDPDSANLNRRRRADDLVRIVIVDDQQMFAESIALLLEREEDLEVVGIAATAAEALEQVNATVPDVAVVDFHLPDGDGAGVTRAILSSSPATRVLILTGAGDERLIVESVEAGCVGFLTKAQAYSELVSAVRKVSADEAYFPTHMFAGLVRMFGNRSKGIGSDLTPRERDILERLREGESTPSIAATAFLSIHTVRNHIRNILMKLNAHSKLEAVAIGYREGLFDE